MTGPAYFILALTGDLPSGFGNSPRLAEKEKFFPTVFGYLLMTLRPNPLNPKVPAMAEKNAFNYLVLSGYVVPLLIIVSRYYTVNIYPR
jgi:hypothetical protein